MDYLDWGGSGVALVFIPGMGDSAHVFDEFAPRFATHFRVLGVTRVGFGDSKQTPPNGFDLASRVKHICATLDALQIERAVLIGHSLGGDEITAFAAMQPGRTVGLIYLDSAIDHTKAFEWEQSLGEFYEGAPTPSTDELASCAVGYQHFWQRLRGVKFPIGEILATIAFDSTGAVRGRRASQQVFMATMNATVRPDFEEVYAPVLALYSDGATDADVFPWLKDKPAEKARAAAVLERVAREVRIERERFAAAVKDAQIFSYRAHHYQFLGDPTDTERRMLAFLSALRRP